TVDRVSLSSDNKPEKDWTVLFYLDGNSDRDRFALSRLRDLEKTGSDDKVNVVAQISRKRSPLLDFISGDWSGVRRYYITQNPDPPNIRYKEFHAHKLPERVGLFSTMIGEALEVGKQKGLTGDGPIDKAKFIHKAIKNSPYNSISNFISDTGEIKSDLLSELGDISMSDPESFKEFLSWGIKNYPARHYIVVVQGHGEGFSGVLSGKDGKMSIPEMEEAMNKFRDETGVKPDILVFDACLMGSAEVAYQLKDTADIMVASQEVESGFTTPADKMVSYIKKSPQDVPLSPSDVAKELVKNCKGNSELNFTPTMSAIDLAKMTEFGQVLDEFTLRLSKADIPDNIMKSLIQDTQHFNLDTSDLDRNLSKFIPTVVNSYVDLYDFTSRLLDSTDINDEELKGAAERLLKNLSIAIIASETTGEEYGRSHGLSILLPEEGSRVLKKNMERYERLGLSKDTNWDEFIKRRIDK
ncbi:MAG TPA: clostripain-related cysteine peptidase, partial [Candidatus Eremiobacteraeota bacterium]|nr:clostripain-related cysteine peptidase [Candidatus Eremiobacteraeota bacterium]